MSLFGSFSRTQSGSSLHKTIPASVMTVLCPRRGHFDHDRPRHRRDLHLLSRRPPAHHPLTPESAESLFFDALARASLCPKHARPISSGHRPSTCPASQSPRSARFTTTAPKSVPPHASALELPPDEAAESTPVPISREDLRSIVDQYDFAPFDQDPPPDRASDQASKDFLVQYNPIPHREPWVALDPRDQESIDHFKHLLQAEDTPPNLHLYTAYRVIPQPRPQYLDNQQIRRFMHLLSVVEYKDEITMHRYLSVVDDMFAAEIPMTIFEWNSAMSFASRYLRRIGDIQVETATQIWLRMEKEAGIKSSPATFSILFDAATKAGKFALADIVIKEMAQRGMKPHRHFRTNIIYSYGLKRDGAAVRNAYQELVDAGEIVDTLVLNCVIASLIHAGEASAAEYIFEKMKVLGTGNPDAAKVKGWKAQRQMGRILFRAGNMLRQQPERRAVVQKVTPIAPNLHTYRLLIKYHAHESGNIDRISELLDEMQQKAIFIHGSIFYQIIRGFSIHGGIRYSSWNKKRLDSLWDVFCDFVRGNKELEQDRSDWVSEEDRGCYFSVSIVKAVLNAYHKVTGSENTRKVWAEIKEVWQPDKKDEEAVNTGLEHALGHDEGGFQRDI